MLLIECSKEVKMNAVLSGALLMLLWPSSSNKPWTCLLTGAILLFWVFNLFSAKMKWSKVRLRWKKVSIGKTMNCNYVSEWVSIKCWRKFLIFIPKEFFAEAAKFHANCKNIADDQNFKLSHSWFRVPTFKEIQQHSKIFTSKFSFCLNLYTFLIKRACTSKK